MKKSTAFAALIAAVLSIQPVLASSPPADPTPDPGPGPSAPGPTGSDDPLWIPETRAAPSPNCEFLPERTIVRVRPGISNEVRQTLTRGCVEQRRQLEADGLL